MNALTCQKGSYAEVSASDCRENVESKPPLIWYAFFRNTLEYSCPDRDRALVLSFGGVGRVVYQKHPPRLSVVEDLAQARMKLLKVRKCSTRPVKALDLRGGLAHQFRLGCSIPPGCLLHRAWLGSI